MEIRNNIRGFMIKNVKLKRKMAILLLLLFTVSNVVVQGAGAVKAEESSRDAIVRIAKEEIGNQEYEKDGIENWNKYSTDLGVDGNGYAWCAIFVYWVFKQAGLKQSVYKNVSNWMSVYYTYNETNGEKHVRGDGYYPVPGDLVVFDWKNGGNQFDHIGIVINYDGSTMTYIDGNSESSNGTVAEHTYSVNEETIYGYICPDYEDSEAVLIKYEELKVDGTVFPEGNLEEGKPFSISGVVQSPSALTKVSVNIYNEAGEWMTGAESEAGGYSFDIHRLDNAISFGKLSAGNYRFVVYAENKGGDKKTLTDKNFSIGNIEGGAQQKKADIKEKIRENAIKLKLYGKKLEKIYTKNPVLIRCFFNEVLENPGFVRVCK